MKAKEPTVGQDSGLMFTKKIFLGVTNNNHDHYIILN